MKPLKPLAWRKRRSDKVTITLLLNTEEVIAGVKKLRVELAEIRRQLERSKFDHPIPLTVPI